MEAIGAYLFDHLTESIQLNNEFKEYFKNIDASEMIDMQYMISNNLKMNGTLILPTNNGKVKNLNSTFSNCQKISVIDLSKINTENVTTISSTFSYCKALIKIVGVIDLKASSSISSMLGYSEAGAPTLLEEVFNGLNMSFCPKLKKECLVYLLENAVVTTVTRTINMGPSNTAKLAPEELAVGTNKGYTIS